MGFALHHGPTKGGTAEGHKFRDWYTATKQAYQVAFGEVSPPDIWPAAAVRFGEAPHFRRVNLRRHWLLPRPAIPKVDERPALPGRRWGLALAALVLVGCTARTPLNPFKWYGPEFLGLFWGLYGLLLALALWLRARGGGPPEPYAGPPLSTYEVVRLAEQGSRLADSALAHSQQIALLPDQKIRRATPTPHRALRARRVEFDCGAGQLESRNCARPGYLPDYRGRARPRPVAPGQGPAAQCCRSPPAQLLSAVGDPRSHAFWVGENGGGVRCAGGRLGF
ncbi:MAG: hypothetical protein WKG07_14070 [Hymenobacter sp.]